MKIGDRVRGTWPIRKVGPNGVVVGTREVGATGTVASLDADRGVAGVKFVGTVVELPVASLTVVGEAPAPTEPRATPLHEVSPVLQAIPRTPLEDMMAAIAAGTESPPPD